jgi:PTS system mannose-specific IIA component
MIGIVVVTHSKLGDALIDAAELIIGDRPEAIVSVSIDTAQDVDKLRGKVAAAIRQVDKKDGVLILTDMFGGTPSNLSYSFLEEGHIEVLSGVNLPVLIEATSSRDRLGLTDLAARLETLGKKSISLASSILKGNKRSDK